MKWKNINEKEAVIGTSFKNHLIINDPNSVVLLCCDFVQVFRRWFYVPRLLRLALALVLALVRFSMRWKRIGGERRSLRICVSLFGKRKKLNFGANSVPKSLISKVYFAKMAISRIFFFSTENYYFKCS